MDYNDRKSEPVDLTNIRKKVEQLKTDMTVRKINEENNQKDIHDMKKDLGTAFFKYEIIQGTESAFYRFEEKMNFKV